MLNLGSDIKIYLSLGITDMRKGINGLSILASSLISDNRISTGTMFVFRGKSADRIKILWWDGQGFCLFYKVLDKGKLFSKINYGSISSLYGKDQNEKFVKERIVKRVSLKLLNKIKLVLNKIENKF